MTLRRSWESATPPPISEKTTMGITRKQPDHAQRDRLMREQIDCQLMAVICIIDPIAEIPCPDQSRR